MAEEREGTREGVPRAASMWRSRRCQADHRLAVFSSEPPALSIKALPVQGTGRGQHSNGHAVVPGRQSQCLVLASPVLHVVSGTLLVT